MARKQKQSASEPAAIPKDSGKNNERGNRANRSPKQDKALGTILEGLTAGDQYMRQLEARVKYAHGEDGLRKLSGLDPNIDPVALAQVAAHFVPQAFSQRAYQQALVKAALLLREAREIVKDGPTIYSIPQELLTSFMREAWLGTLTPSGEISKIERMADPRKRFVARAKLITRQNKADRAETDVCEFLGHLDRAEGITDIPADKQKWRELLKAPSVDWVIIDNLQIAFARWKEQATSLRASELGKKSAESRAAKK
jgi:hypothetical protein